jgi:hypothetical protein
VSPCPNLTISNYFDLLSVVSVRLLKLVTRYISEEIIVRFLKVIPVRKFLNRLEISNWKEIKGVAV